MSNGQDGGERNQPNDMSTSEPFGYHSDSASPAVAAYLRFRETRIENRAENINEILLQLEARKAKHRLLQRLERDELLSASDQKRDAPIANGLLASIRSGWQRVVGGQQVSPGDEPRRSNGWFASLGSLGPLGVGAAVAVLAIVVIPILVLNWEETATAPASYVSTPQVPETLLAMVAQGNVDDPLLTPVRGSTDLPQTTSRYFWVGMAVSELLVKLASPAPPANDADGAKTSIDDLVRLAAQTEDPLVEAALTKLIDAATPVSASSTPTDVTRIDGTLSELNKAIAQSSVGAQKDWWFRLGKSVVALDYSLVSKNAAVLHDSFRQFDKLFPVTSDPAAQPALVATIERLRLFVGQRDFEDSDRRTIANSLKRVSSLARQ